MINQFKLIKALSLPIKYSRIFTQPPALIKSQCFNFSQESTQERNALKEQNIEKLQLKRKGMLVEKEDGDSHLPQSLEVQEDLVSVKPSTMQLEEQLTYSQEYYILNREKLMDKKREKEMEAKFGDYSARLVKRPQKNFLWGYGTQVHDDNRGFFRHGELPTIKEIIKFLEVYQMKDISVVNLKALGRDLTENYAIVSSGFSIKHLYNTAKLLCQEVKKLECPQIVNQPKVAGRKDDSWMMVTVKEIQVHMILNEYRYDLDLEFRWLNSPPEEMVNKWKLYESLGKKSQNLDINDDTFKTYKHKDGMNNNFVQSTSSDSNSFNTQSSQKAPGFADALGPSSSQQSRPQFFNSARKDSNVAPQQQNQVKPLTTIKEQTQENNQSSSGSRSFTNSADNRQIEGQTSFINQGNEEKKSNLSRQKIYSSQLPQYEVQDGEFESYPEISQKTAEKLKLRGIQNLFPIQQHCFYPIYNREDVIARDLTGSGKTLAFGLPLVEYLRKNKYIGQGSQRKIQAIVLAPTRELAIQVQNELSKLKLYEDEFRTLTVYGGVSIDDQTRELRRGVDIFVGTVGRVLDHINRENIDFSQLKTIVLDEADQMLNLGFKEDVEAIMKIIKDSCKFDVQTCLFSATIPQWVKQVAENYLKKNYRIIDLAQNLKNKTAKKVAHLAINCPQDNLVSALADLLICYGGDGRTIVFTQTKSDANQLILTDKIKKDIEVMHGDIAQNQREVTLKRFREGKFNVLVATDVASRGLDIPNVDLVIQVEPPNDVETYIHRSGRTARAGKEGTCITFYTQKTQWMIKEIEQKAGIQFKIIGVPQPEDVIKASSKVILKNLEMVNKQVLPFFSEAASLLIADSNNNPQEALCKALAYISGYYKNALSSRSLLTGQERLLTLLLKTSQPCTLSQAAQLLKTYFPSDLVDRLSKMRLLQDNSGIVFDIAEESSERFLEIGIHLKETDSRIDFDITKCLSLPELAQERAGFQDDWRGGTGNSGGGKYSHGRHQSYGGGGSSNFNNTTQQSSSWGNQGRHTRQGSNISWSGTNTNQGKGYNNGGGGAKSYQHSRKNSNIGREWDQESGKSNQQSDFDDMQDIDVNVNFSNADNTAQKYVFNNPSSADESTKVFISNLHFSVREDELREFFEENKLNVVKLNILKNEKGQNKGTGFVEFGNLKDANFAVVKLNGTMFSSRPAKFEYAQTPLAKKPSSSYGGTGYKQY